MLEKHGTAYYVKYTDQYSPGISWQVKKTKNQNAHHCWEKIIEHVPQVVRKPVSKRSSAADELQMLGLALLFADKEHQKACRNERHGHNNKDGNHNVRA